RLEQADKPIQLKAPFGAFFLEIFNVKKLLFAIPLVVPFYSHSSDGMGIRSTMKEGGGSAETVESCLAKSHTENSFTNVWKDDKTLDRYANYVYA
ncbi:hypothetical protein, partial [Salmonella enterica]|uniref:hypothetical protein n=1 Tax=Salmonella enterica TaxID=28901 RepID=UPI00309DCF5C